MTPERQQQIETLAVKLLGAELNEDATSYEIPGRTTGNCPSRIALAIKVDGEWLWYWNPFTNYANCKDLRNKVHGFGYSYSVSFCLNDRASAIIFNDGYTTKLVSGGVSEEEAFSLAALQLPECKRKCNHLWIYRQLPKDKYPCQKTCKCCGIAIDLDPTKAEEKQT